MRIIGQSACPRETAEQAVAAGSAKPWSTDGVPFPSAVERRALEYYRAILGGQETECRREDGTVIWRGVSGKVRARLTTPKERELTTEILNRGSGISAKG